MYFAGPLSIPLSSQIEGAPQSNMHFSRPQKCILPFFCPSRKAIKSRGPKKPNAFSQHPKNACCRSFIHPPRPSYTKPKAFSSHKKKEFELQAKVPHKATCTFRASKMHFLVRLSIPQGHQMEGLHIFQSPNSHFAGPGSQIQGPHKATCIFSRPHKCILQVLYLPAKAFKLKGPYKATCIFPSSFVHFPHAQLEGADFSL